MKEFFDFTTPYSSEDYKILKQVVNMGIDSSLEGFTKSQFKKAPYDNGRFMFSFHVSELPILFRRLEDLYNKTGNEDYESLKDDIAAGYDAYVSAVSSEMQVDEMIDPYDPMDYNQTITGEPTSTSDLADGGVDTAAPYSDAPSAFKNQAIEDYIDDDTIGQEMMAEVEISEAELKEMIKGNLNELSQSEAEWELLHKIVKISNSQDEHGNFEKEGVVASIIEPTERQLERGYRLVNYVVVFSNGKEYTYLRSEFEPVQNESLGTLGMSYDKQGSKFPEMEENSSDSLANKHGMNAKPETLIDETTDTEKYEDVVFLQGEEANEAMDILNNDGKDAALDYLKQWHYPGEHMGKNEVGHGTEDRTYKKDGYIMNWNPYLPYIGLTYDTEFDLNEDSIMRRKLAGQRGKTAPLGQHAPHSQAAKK